MHCPAVIRMGIRRAGYRPKYPKNTGDCIAVRFPLALPKTGREGPLKERALLSQHLSPIRGDIRERSWLNRRSGSDTTARFDSVLTSRACMDSEMNSRLSG